MTGNVEGFEKVFDVENPNYEKDFDKLMWKYIDNKEKEIKKERLRVRLRKAEKLSIISKIILSDSWIVDMNLTPSKSEAEQKEKRIKTIVYMLDEIGLIEDMVEYFGSEEKTATELRTLIDRLFEDQVRRKGIKNVLGL